MFDSAILGQVALGYSTFIDRERRVDATRLTVVPLRPGVRLDAAQLLAVVRSVWPEACGRVSLDVVSESLLQDLLDAQPAKNLMIEVPSFMATDEANAEAIRTLHANGSTLLIKGRPIREVPRDVLPCFSYSIIDRADDRRVNSGPPPVGVKRSIAFVQSGVRSRDDMEESFSRGAAAVLGWPIDDVIGADPEAASSTLPDSAVLAELVARIDADAGIDRLETVLRCDPALAYRLMRHVEAQSAGLQLERASLRQSIMMMGFGRLRHWLGALKAEARSDAAVHPLVFAAVRRGLMMEALGDDSDDETREEMALCGMFSLLDRMFQQPFDSLFESVSLPERVYQALVERQGPYFRYLDVLHAVESGSLESFRAAAEQSMLGVAEINRALLHALVVAARAP